MNYWLIKSEPETWSWDQQVKKGAKGEAWTGVRNHTAKQNLMKMKKGDRAFFYHSGEGKEIVGIAEVIRESFPDPTASPGDPWVAVDVKRRHAARQSRCLSRPSRPSRSSRTWRSSSNRGSRCSRSRRRNGSSSAPWAE